MSRIGSLAYGMSGKEVSGRDGRKEKAADDGSPALKVVESVPVDVEMQEVKGGGAKAYSPSIDDEMAEDAVY